MKRDAESGTERYYLFFAQTQKRRVQTHRPAFAARLCSQVGGGLKRLEKLRAAIRVTAVILVVRPDENIPRPFRLCYGKRAA